MQPETDSAAQAAAHFHTTTLAELGPRLPIGIAGPDGGLGKELECRDWRGREEREVDRLKRKSRQKGDFISKLLGYMFTRVGPHELATMQPAEVQAAISRLWRADAMYMYVWLRTECIGHELDLEITCTQCGFRIPWQGDLRTLEVRTTDRLEPLEWTYTLVKPFELRGERVESLRLRPNRWLFFEETVRRAMAEGDSGVLSVDLIRDAIVGVNGQAEIRALVASDLDDITKRDLEALAAAIDKRELGPDLSISETCPRCARQFQTSMDWGYASFFSISGR